MLQLAHVAIPRQPGHLLLGICREGQAWFVVHVGIALQEHPGQRHDVVGPFAEGRQVQLYGVDAVEQVFPELPPGHHLLQVAVGGAEQSHVHVDGLAASHAHDAAALQRREQLGLEGIAQVADLVEKQRTAVGQLKLARLVGLGIGESPLHMAEELALEERLGHRAHVDGHQAMAAALRQAVYLAGQHLLARAVLARDEDVGIGGRHLLHHLPELTHGLRVAPVHGRLVGVLVAM